MTRDKLSPSAVVGLGQFVAMKDYEELPRTSEVYGCGSGIRGSPRSRRVGAVLFGEGQSVSFLSIFVPLQKPPAQ